jgi:hypothetical protein
MGIVVRNADRNALTSRNARSLHYTGGLEARRFGPEWPPSPGVMTMPNNPTNTTLDVRNSASNGGGWTNVQAANGATYSYLYTGGTQPGNNGAMVFSVGGGNAAITLTFASTTDTRYEFDTISFVNDPNQQLSTQGNAPRTRVVNDKCTDVLDGSYKVLVKDTTANTTIPCDPTIKNQPPAP